MPIARVQMPDGRIGRFDVPADYSPAQIEDLANQTHEAQSVSTDIAQPQQAPSEIGSIYRGVQQGTTANLSDEIQAGLGAGYAKLFGGSATADSSLGDLYNQSLQNQGQQLKQDYSQNPVGAIGGNVLGSILTGAGIAGTARGGTLVNSLRSGEILGKDLGIAGQAIKGVGAGATSGALYGAGSADQGQRFQGAEQGAAFGGILGGATPLVIGTGSKVLSNTINKLTDIKAIKSAVNAGEIIAPESLPTPLQKIATRLRADFPNDAEYQTKLNSYLSTQGQSLLEAGGERTKNLAEGAAVYPSGASKANEFFNAKTDVAGENLKGTLNKTISPSTNYYDSLDQMVEAGQNQASPLYKEAYKANQSIQSPVIDRILNTPEGKSALGEAVKNVQNEMSLVAKPDPELTALNNELSQLVDKDGQSLSSGGSMAKGLKLRTLDYVKRAMDTTIGKAYRAGDNGEAGRIINLKKGLVSEIDNADKSGLYAKARKVSGDYLSNKDAMDSGLSFLKDDKEIIAKNFSSMGPTERKSYKVGVVKNLRNQIENTTDGRNVANLFNKPSVKDKLSTILNPTEYNKLLNDAKTTDNIFKLKNQITGNSRTALRQATASEFDNEGHQLIADIADRGITGTVRNRAIGWMTKQFDGLSNKTASEVADILYETDPKKKYQIVKSLVNDANNTKIALRKTEAANKLAAFYSISDKIAQQKSITPLTAGAIAGSNQ